MINLVKSEMGIKIHVHIYKYVFCHLGKPAIQQLPGDSICIKKLRLRVTELRN